MAVAQDKTYSADSLLATFQKGSPISLKGTEIKFVGVIAEVKKSRVVFKSSGEDKITCELVTPIGTSKDVPVVGGSLTVVGKVRGRGMMGNVTLDPCVRTLTDPAPATAPPPAVIPEPLPEKTEPEVVVEPTPEPAAELPPPEPSNNTQTVAQAAAAPIRKVRTPQTPLAAPEPVVETAALDQPKQPDAPAPQPVQVETSVPRTIGSMSYLPIFVATAIGIGVGALLVFMKMRPATSPAFRSESASTPQDERRAALEALLLGKKKRK
jgi:hypothetical protein